MHQVTQEKAGQEGVAAHLAQLRRTYARLLRRALWHCCCVGLQHRSLRLWVCHAAWELLPKGPCCVNFSCSAVVYHQGPNPAGLPRTAAWTLHYFSIIMKLRLERLVPQHCSSPQVKGNECHFLQVQAALRDRVARGAYLTCSWTSNGVRVSQTRTLL